MKRITSRGLAGLFARVPRLLVIIVSFLIVLIAILWTATHLITAGTFAEIEVRDVEEGTRRAEVALEGSLVALGRVARDYAEWDDAYGFATGAYPEFLEENAIPDAMDNLSIDFMAVIRPGDARDGRLMTPGGLVVNAPTAILGVLASEVVSGSYDPLSEVGDGILPTEQGTFLFATSPIKDTGGTKKAGAFLAVGRRFDRDVVAEIERASRLSVEVSKMSSLRLLPVDAQAQLQASSGVSVIPLSSDQIRGTTVIESIDGKPAALMSVTMTRTAQFIGGKAINLLRYALLAFGILASASVAHVVSLQHREMTKRMHAEEAMRASEERHRNLIEHMADAVFGVSQDGTIVFANPQGSKLSGLDETRLVGSSASGLMTREAWNRVSSNLKLDSLRGVSESFEIDIVHVSGRTVPVEINASPMDGEDGSPQGVQWIARDVTDRRRFEQELVHLANRDHLTGLFNRRRFEEELTRQLGNTDRTGREGALLWLDIDFFKDINDSLGHQAGDQVLVGIAAVAAGKLRADSVLARLGGDEFAVLLPDTSRKQAEECADRLIDAVRNASGLLSGKDVRVTTSMGVVLFPEHGRTVEELLARADLAMYRAKEDGRNRYCVYDDGEGWHDEQRTRFDWRSRIEKALREDLFVVYAQPVMNLASGETDRHELLIRMEAEDGSILPPDSFLPVAERTGLIHRIDQWMVRRAIDLISMRSGRDGSFRLDVNLSGRAFSDAELLRVIESELIRTDIEPSSFGVEITETAAISDMGKAREFITRLRNMGCRVSLDDFGSGFSSFYYLKNLQVDCLKIDGSFVQNMCTNLQDQHVVKAMVELSEGFGISCTAEFVEDQATLELLRSFGVTYAQGYHISRPFPMSEMGEAPQDAVSF